jgi:hypothetical protein
MLKYELTLIKNKWQITSSNGLSYTIPNHIGMFYITELLKNTNKEILYTHLISRGIYQKPLYEFRGKQYKLELLKYGLHEENWYSEMPKADKKTIYEVGKEILHIKDQIAELREYSDFARIDVLEKELKKLISYLKGIRSSKNILRMFNTEQTAIQSCVRRAIRRVFNLIYAKDKVLTSFLRSHVHPNLDYIQMDDDDGVEISIGRS